jgi:hypothetical protein
MAMAELHFRMQRLGTEWSTVRLPESKVIVRWQLAGGEGADLR